MTLRSFARPSVAMTLCLVVLISGAMSIAAPVSLVVPGFGPGVAGTVVVGPTAPVCLPEQPCDRPFAGARVMVLTVDPTAHVPTEIPVGIAVTNAQGNFIVSAPPGDYAVQIDTAPDHLPICTPVAVTVSGRHLTLVEVQCDTGMR
jgi:hypothetical protein